MSNPKKTILITGATDGIGKLTALKLAEEGYRILLHGRNAQKLSDVADEVRSSSRNEDIQECVADFSSLNMVRDLARQVKNDYSSLDVLINNAGAGFGNERQESQDGYELLFAVNYLAPFLLTNLLLPTLQEGSRIVNVASGAQQSIDFDDVFLKKNYNSTRAYSQSKLALIMFTFSLAERLREKNITANTLHPGTYLNTKMVTEAGITPMGEPEEGAEAIIYLATSQDLDGTTGKYFNQKKETKAATDAYDAQKREKLWELSEQYTHLKSRARL